MDVLEEIRKLVNRRGSQRAVAEELGISPQYLCDILQERRGASSNILKKLGLKVVYVRERRKATA